jgi:hypothetical protein
MPATTREARILLLETREAAARLLRRGVRSPLPPGTGTTVAGGDLAVLPIRPDPGVSRLHDGSV